MDDGELVGIVSEADLLALELVPIPELTSFPRPMGLSGFRRWSPKVMTRAVVVLPEDADVVEAGRLLLERRITSIPVVRGRRSSGSWPGGTC